MFFPVAVSDLPTPPPPPPVVLTVPAPVSAPPAVIVVTTTTTRPLAVSGHYSCQGEVCSLDPDPTPHPLAPGSDVPGQTLGSLDPAYGKSLSDQLCEVKAWLCSSGV